VKRRRGGARSSAGDADSDKFAMFAPPIGKEMPEQRFSVPSAPAKTAATQRTSRRAKQATQQSAMPERLLTMDALVSIEPGS
jgi:hypothetical protein